MVGNRMTCGPRLIYETAVFCETPRLNPVIVMTLRNDSDNYDVLLTVHLSIFILVINPLNTELNPICQ